MGFQQGLSGLNVSSKSLDAIGNNVANGSTIGFKGSKALFADVYASTVRTSAGVGAYVPSIRQNFGQGNLSSSNNALDLGVNGSGMFRLSDNGTITFTRNGEFSTDKSGFIIAPGGQNLTGYGVDANGNVIPGDFQNLQVSTNNIAPKTTSEAQVVFNLDSRATPPSGYTAGTATATNAPATLTINAANNALTLTVDGTASGAITIPSATYGSDDALAAAVETAINNDATLVAANALVDVTVNSAGRLVITSRNPVLGVNSAVTAVAGTAFTSMMTGAAYVAGSGSFDPTDSRTYTASTAQVEYDTLGNPHTLTMYFVKTGVPNTWDSYTTLDGDLTTMMGPTTLGFSTAGALINPAAGTPIVQSFAITTGATSPLVFDLDYAGSTQYGASFGVTQLLQDGYTSGRLTGISISADGIVQGRYSNGKSQNMGQVVIANFNNLNGLQPLGDNQWAETSESGQPIVGAPSSGSLGSVQSGSLEEANIDLTAELVNMITQQRSYQANAQTIKTQDQVLSTLVNLR